MGETAIRAQASLDALVSFAALLSALALLIASSRGFAGAFEAQVENSALSLQVANDALLSDTACFSSSHAGYNFTLQSIPAEGGFFASRQKQSVHEPLLCNASISQQGSLKIEGVPYEPI